MLLCLNAEYFKDAFHNISGYGFSSNIYQKSSIIPHNTITKSTDFKLMSLRNQLKYSVIRPSSFYNTHTSNGIIPVTNKDLPNIMVFPGSCDMILKQNNREVWPNNMKDLKPDALTNIEVNTAGHMRPVYDLLSVLGYSKLDRVHTVTYDFRNFDIDNIIDNLIEYYKGNDKKTIIIAYDFGCVIANLYVHSLKKQNHVLYNKISNLLYICPTFGGTAIALKDYFDNVKNPNISQSNSLLMNFPMEGFYKKPVIIFRDIGYMPKNIPKLMAHVENTSPNYTKLMNLQKISLEDPGIKTIIVANKQFNTPSTYDYKNNLLGKPVSYLRETNNLSPSFQTPSNPEGTIKGLQVEGDSIVPINNIYKICENWKNTCNLELVRDKDHFTILESYELGLLISSLI